MMMQWMQKQILVVTAALLLMGGCTTTDLVPPDLKEPGWLISAGEAIWLADPNQPAITAEVLLASRDNGDTVAMMTKPPLEIFQAQAQGKSWQLDFPPTDKKHSGRGIPPKKFIWFRIPAMIQREQPLPDPWLVGIADDVWIISNPDTGESIRLRLYE